jgi:molybdenum-dependent DNA-binding transcriptional regulator ModE
MQMSDRIGKRIKLQDVHVLMAVVQAGSMSKAARHLNTSQPNISKSIADLERALGVRLRDRHRQGIEPTDYGRALLSGGAAVFDELRQTVKNIEFLADPAAGEVRFKRRAGRELYLRYHRSAIPTLSAHRVSSRDRIWRGVARGTSRAQCRPLDCTEIRSHPR